MPSITCQVVPKTAPLNDTRRRQYRLKSQASVGGTDIQNTRILLEVPVLRMPNVFLELAEEARNSEMVDDQSTDKKDVKSHRTGQARPVFVTEIMNSTPVLGSRSFRVTNTSTEMTPDMNLDKPMIGSGPVGQLSDTEQPITLGVMMKQGADGPIGPVGRDVLLTGRLEMVARPDSVGPHSRPEQSVSLRLDADQGEHIPTHRVHPGVKMFRAQPVADGPAGPDRTRRPVGTDEMYAVHDDVRPTAGGPVGRFPDPGPLKYSKISLDDSYQPLFTGPLGTNEMNAINDRSRPTASGPLGRQCSLDPMGPRAMLSLGDGNQPPSVGPVGRPWIPEQPGDQVTESDFKRTTQTRSESESDTGATDSVIRTESDAQTDRANISMANGPTDSNVIPSSSDSAVHSLGERLTQTKSVSKSVAGIPDPVIQTGSEVHTDQVNISMVNGPTDSTVISPSSDSDMRSLGERLIQTKSVSESVAGIPDPVIQTECEVQIDRVNIGIANGPTDSSITPPSSDSGIHSLGEQWENMSANSMSTESIQTVKTFYGGAMSQEDKKNPQEIRKVGFFVKTVCGKNDMKWYQQDLELLRKSAKNDYQQTRPMLCRFCGKVIRVDMYRHVARLHLDLVQLWRCPIAWCTTWKGSPQDCLEHVRSGHDAPWVSKTASIEKYAPPWTVRRQLWTDSLRIEHSGISTDMLLFSEVGMPLTQHYRVYKGGLPHAVFRTDYLPRLRSLLPSPGGADTSPEVWCDSDISATPASVVVA